MCTREPGEPPRYQVHVYVAGGATVTATLAWDADGQAKLEPTPADGWVASELLKLARVLRRSGQARLVRWRG